VYNENAQNWTNDTFYKQQIADGQGVRLNATDGIKTKSVNTDDSKGGEKKWYLNVLGFLTGTTEKTEVTEKSKPSVPVGLIVMILGLMGLLTFLGMKYL
jgi:hypothetical protein